MILISVKSEVMDTKRQFENEKDAEKHLKFVKDFHDASRMQRVGLKSTSKTKVDLRGIIPLKVEIIDTEHAQLCIPELLNETRIIK